jgi:hypothetical protein
LISTVEVRWFFQGTISPQVQAWFHGGQGQAAPAQARVDHYLRIADGDALGIKLREGRIEVKQRERQLGTVPLQARVSGVVEHWRKWSFPLTRRKGAALDTPVPALGWVGVHKERQLSRYRITSDRGLVAVSPAQYPDQGCDLELTKVFACGSEWWTLGFEAFGAETNLQDLLSFTAGQLLAATEPPLLAAQDSYGYPRWLQILAQQKEASTTPTAAASS